MALQLISLASFGIVFSLLPLRVVPLITRLAFVLAIAVLILPSVHPAMSLSDLLIWVFNFGSESTLSLKLSAMSVFLAIASGALFAVLVSTGAYTVFCFAKWSSVLIFGKEWCDRDVLADERAEGPDVVQTLFSLIFVSVLVLVVGAECIAEFIGLGLLLFLQLPEFSTELDSSWVLAKVGFTLVIEAGRLAFLSGLIIGMPLFLTSLIVDFVYVVSNRYLSDMGWSQALRIPLLVLVLLLTLPQLAAQVVSVARDTTGKEAVRRFGTTIIQANQQSVDQNSEFLKP